MSRSEQVSPLKAGKRAAKYGIRGWDGTHSILRAYSAGKIDRRTVLGQWITERENEYARHLGEESYSLLPVTVRGKVHLIIRQELFLSLREPQDPKAPGAFNDIRSSEKLLSSLLTELGLKRAEKPVPTLQEYMQQREHEMQEKEN